MFHSELSTDARTVPSTIKMEGGDWGVLSFWLGKGDSVPLVNV